MTPRAAITEGFLRRAMRDDRYWRSGHPERSAFVSWVTDGFQALEEHGGATGGTVFVRAYTRTVKGKPVHVQAHQRAAPPGREESIVPAAGSRGAGSRDGAEWDEAWSDDDVVPVMGRRRGQSTEPDQPRRDPGPPMERIPGQTGKENADDRPSWARGIPRGQNETPTQYADRIMDQQWPNGWRGNADREREHQQIQKFGGRAFRMPRARGRE